MENIPKQFYYKKNRLHQLRGFYYTVKLGSPSKAAKYLNLGNSTITMQIQALERDLDTELFIKNRNSFGLTSMGELLFSMAAPAVQQMDGLYEKFFQRKKKIELNKIDIAAHHIAISYLLPSFLKDFRNLYPEVSISIRNIAPDDALERLKDEKIDLMLYPTSDIPDECYFRPSFSYEPILLMSKDHPISKFNQDNITLTEIAKYDLVRIDPKLITLPLFENTVKTYGIGSNISFENGNWEMLKHFVRAEIGLALVSTICFNENDNDLKAISLTKFFPKMHYGIMVKKGRYFNDTVKYFITMMDQNFFKFLNEKN